MPRIQVLSAHIANQIAAGEVVERPASIVKELVENAVDAGATALTIEIENGGLDSIRISDNGCGIADEDVETAFLRHATSKLRTAEDLGRIETLGFRGEALASIGAVTCMTLKTRTDEDELGSELCVRGGKLEWHKRIGCTTGTVIEVRELFYNAPARLKFLKSSRAESGAIGDYAAKLIMSLPWVSIRYINNGKDVYHSIGDGDLRNAILCVYGPEMAPQLVKGDFDDGYLKINGYVGTPAISRFNRSAQALFLNRRIIRSAALSNALSRAYDTRLMSGRFPFAVLSLQIASAEVDVNVHPAKLEVRFRDEARVARTVQVCCSEALTRSYVPEAAEVELQTQQPPLIHSRFPSERTQTAWSVPSGAAIRSLHEAQGNEGSIPRIHISSGAQIPAGQATVPTPFSEPYAVVGCAFMTYWFVQQSEVLYCIDQHAAHERLLYDALMAQSMPVVSQALLFPEELTLSAEELIVLQDNRNALEAFGFIFSGPNGLQLTLLAVPQIGQTPLKSVFLHDALARLGGGEPDALHTQSFFRDAVAQAACKHAVKAGEAIDREQMKTLLNALSCNDALLSCPHGRPIAIRLSKTELEKWFKRIL